MPAKRQQQREKRLSDFFPAINAPSPININSARRTRQKATSTPVADSTPRRSPRKRNQQKPSINTPTFDPDVHVDNDNLSHDSEEDDFVKSLHFSAAKEHSSKSFSELQQGIVKDYEVIIDYNSDSDGFAFSPVKFTPPSAARKVIKRVKGTPRPQAKPQGGPRMVWNSATKKIEEVIIDAGSQSTTQNHVKNSTPIMPSFKLPEHNSDSDEDESSDAEDDQEATVHQGLEGRIEVETTPASRGRTLTSHLSSQKGTIPGSSNVTTGSRKASPGNDKIGLPFIDRRSSRKSSIRSVPLMASQPLSRRVRNVQRKSVEDNRSPRISLTRAVSGSLASQKLEKLPIPDYVLSSENDTVRKRQHRMQPFARLPKKIPTTVPKPFDLSRARPKASTLITNEIEEPANSMPVLRTDRAANRDVKGTYGQIPGAEQSPMLSRKRKNNEADHELVGLQSPAKRIKINDERPGPIASLKASRKRPKHTPTIPSFEFSSQDVLRQRAEEREARLRRQAEQDKRAQEPATAGVVPRTLYSPEKQFRLNKIASATKPQPFKFSTEARAARSPSVKSPAKENLVPPQRKSNALRVPVLERAPFIPKPSDHAATIAASPARKLPTRLETRREFDKVAERHAEQVVQKKRHAEEMMAIERERRINERKGWQDSGKAAIEQWAAKAKTNGDGRRDWLD